MHIDEKISDLFNTEKTNSEVHLKKKDKYSEHNIEYIHLVVIMQRNTTIQCY